MTCRPHPPPDADQFPQLSRRAARRRRASRSCWSGRTAPARPICIEAISFLAPGRGLRRATLDEVAFTEGDGSWAVSAEVEGALGLATLGTGIEPPAGEDATRRAQVPHRPRAGRLRRGLRRPPARGLAGAGDGQLFTGPASERRRFLDRLVLAVDAEHMPPRQRARARAALAQPAAGGAAPRPALARRHRARDRRACGRGRGAARRDGATGCRRALAAPQGRPPFPSAEIALDGWMEQLVAAASRGRGRGPLPRRAARQPRPRRRRRPHARRPAPHRPRGGLCRQGHRRRRRLDRRAEGAADRPGAGACRADRRDDGLCAGAAARRGGRASRPVAPRRAL